MTDFLMNQTDIMHENPRFSDGLGGGAKHSLWRVQGALESPGSASRPIKNVQNRR